MFSKERPLTVLPVYTTPIYYVIIMQPRCWYKNDDYYFTFYKDVTVYPIFSMYLTNITRIRIYVTLYCKHAWTFPGKWGLFGRIPTQKSAVDISYRRYFFKKILRYASDILF